MPKRRWTDEENAYILNNPHLKEHELWAHLGGHHGDTIAYRQQRYRLYKRQKAKDLLNVIERRRFPVTDMPAHEGGPIIETDSILILSDVHAAHQDARFLEQVVSLAESWRITHCLVNGDLFDHAQFKSYPGRRHESTLEDELTDVRHIMFALCEAFTQVYYNMGNHEERWLLRELNSMLPIEDWKRLWTTRDNIQVTDYAHHFIYGQRKYVAGHPGQYSKDPAKVATNIHKERFPDHNVITAHTHHVGMVQRRNSCGTFWCIDGGTCAVHGTFEYVAKGFNAMPAMNTGAVIIRDGRPYLLTPDSDWDGLKRMVV